MTEPVLNTSLAPSGSLINPCHDHLLDGGGNGDGLDVLDEVTAPFLHSMIFKSFRDLMNSSMKKGIPSAFCRIRSSRFRSMSLVRKDMLDHGEALTVGEFVQGNLAMIGPAPPGMDELGPVGEDEEYPGARYAL